MGAAPKPTKLYEMKTKTLFVPVLAVLGLTACERTLDVGEDNASTGQVKNSVLQVRTRGASGDGATVAYPVAVYVFEGDECKTSQTIGDEGQTLNIALTEGTYSVYAVGGVSSSDYVLPSVSDALTSSAIALQERKVLTDLMTASATVTLVDGDDRRRSFPSHKARLPVAFHSAAEKESHE